MPVRHRVDARRGDQRMRCALRAVLVELGLEQGVHRRVEIERRTGRARDAEPPIEIEAARAVREELDLGSAQGKGRSGTGLEELCGSHAVSLAALQEIEIAVIERVRAQRLLFPDAAEQFPRKVLREVKPVFHKTRQMGSNRRNQTAPPCDRQNTKRAGDRNAQPYRLPPHGFIVQNHDCVPAQVRNRPQNAGLPFAKPGKFGLRPFTAQHAYPARTQRGTKLRCAGKFLVRQHFAADFRRDGHDRKQAAQQLEAVRRGEPDQRARVADDEPFFSHASRLLTSSRSVLALPRMIGTPARPISCMNSASAMPATFAARPSEMLPPL